MSAPSDVLVRLVSEKSLAGISSVAPSAEAFSTTQDQYKAVEALIDFSNGDILAFLKLVRSARTIEPSLERRPGGAHLSPSQIQALLTLKDCPNDRLEVYLVHARIDRLYNDLAVFNRDADSLEKAMAQTMRLSLLAPQLILDPPTIPCLSSNHQTIHCSRQERGWNPANKTPRCLIPAHMVDDNSLSTTSTSLGTTP